MNDDSLSDACSVCGSPTERRPNPYYGSGLSVHPHLRVCPRCTTVSLEPVPASAAADDEEARGPRPRSLRGRVADWYRALP